MANIGNGNPTSNQKILHLLSLGEMTEAFEPPNWLIEGVLQRRFIYSLTGQTGHAKTAVALLLAELMASTAIDDPTLAGHRVEKGKVLYLVGENPDDVTMRLIGANLPPDTRMWFIKGVFNIALAWSCLEHFAYELHGVDLVIVDTSAAYFPGEEENSNTEIGDHARNLRRLVELPGEPTALVLCHPAKYVTDPELLVPRGGGAFLNEIDGNLTLRRIGNGATTVVELHHSVKFRGPGFEPISFRLEKVTTTRLADARGNLIPTVRAVPINQHDLELEEGKGTAYENQAMTVLLRAGPSGIDSVAEIARLCGWLWPSGEPAKSRAQKALETLRYDKMVKNVRKAWILTEAGKDAARKIALKNQDDIA